jgi:cellulose synthase (UDP-forming)
MLPGRIPLAPPRRGRQALALVALASGVAYLAWRFGFTLSVDTLWLGLPLALAETWALLAVGLFVFSAWRLSVRRPPADAPPLSVAILVPTYNEPPDVLRATILGALGVRGAPRPTVWVLDDGARAWVATMCRELGVRYLVRPAPRRGAKAGNLNHAIGIIDSDLYLVLDADHVPLPAMLERTIGYFADPEVAFVQCPQAFFNRSFQHPREADDPVRNEQSLFYDVICRGKDRDNAAFWCGSSAVVRREALLSIGGVATDTVVEDTHTAMKLHGAGWRSVYHHEVLAVGLAPEEVRSFLTQRGRWARGCFQMMRRDNPLWARGLTWRQRLHYFSSVSHYLEGPQRLIGLAVPPITLATGVLPLAADQLTYLCLFIPQLILVPLATWAVAEGRYRFFESERFALVRVITYTRAASSMLLRKPVTFAVTPKGGDSRGASPVRAVAGHLALALIAVGTAGYQTAAQLLELPGRLSLFAYCVTIFWALASAGLLGWVSWWASRVRHRRRAHRFPTRLPAVVGFGDGAAAELPAEVRDLSPFGASLAVEEEPPAGAPATLVMLLDDGPVAVAGEVAAAHPMDEGWRAGVRFANLDSEAGDAIIRWCFRNPFGPAGPSADQEPEAGSREPQITTPAPKLSRRSRSERNPAAR